MSALTRIPLDPGEEFIARSYRQLATISIRPSEAYNKATDEIDKKSNEDYDEFLYEILAE